jgi:hypothetical protein
MSTGGTMLSDLGDATPVAGDGDLVKRILADLNTTESPMNPVVQGGRPVASMPPPGSNGRMISAPNPNTTYPLAMDPATATAHMIGKDYPSAADFASMMGGPAAYAGAMPPMHVAARPAAQQPVLAQLTNGKGWSADLMVQLKQPLFVALIVLFISLPVVNVMIGHYMPSLLRVGGDLTTMGLIVKALGAGALYWALVNVVVPLVASA